MRQIFGCSESRCCKWVDTMAEKRKSKLRLLLEESHPAIKIFGAGGILLVLLFFVLGSIFSHEIELWWDSHVRHREGSAQTEAAPTFSPLRELVSPVALSVVVGKHANANQFTGSYYDTLRIYLKKAIDGGFVSIVLLDGEPREIMHQAFDNPIARSRNKKAREYYIEREIDRYIQEIQGENIFPSKEEVNTLLAIKEAVRSLNAAPSGLQKYILVMDTGIPTKGDLNLASDCILEYTPVEILNRLLSENIEFPDLKDCSLIWIGLGDVAFPQEIDESNIATIRTLWTRLLAACGAKYDLKDLPKGSIPNLAIDEGSDPTAKGFPRVTPVRFNKLNISWADRKAEPQIITELAIGFIPDSNKFISEESVKYILTSYAESIIAQGSRVLLVGTSANLPGREDNTALIALSKSRSEAVRNKLIELGVPAENLVVIGMGPNAPWHEDEMVDGIYSEEIARKNRAVTLLPLDSDLALSVMKDTEE